jgi:hypothetical protein
MSSWYEQAAAKLKAEYSQVKGQKEQAMRSAVRDVLLEFCRQDEEFAQAVVQGGSYDRRGQGGGRLYLRSGGLPQGGILLL